MVGLQQGLASLLLLLLLLDVQAVENSMVSEECSGRPCTASCTLNIIVSQNGHDCRKCLSEQSPTECRTLGYVLGKLSSYRNDCVQVKVDYSHDLNYDVKLTHIQNLAIIGHEQKPVITYCGSRSAVSFEYSRNISIGKITWEQCSNDSITMPSTLNFTHCHNVEIISCSFLSKQGSTGAIMYDVHGDVRVSSTKFTNNIASTLYPISASNCECIPSGGLHIHLTSSHECSNYTNYVISSCHFADSHNSRCSCDQQNCSLGNALFLQVNSSYYTGSTFHIVGNTFENNTYSCPSERANVHATFILSLEIGSDDNIPLSSSEKNQFMIEKNLFHCNTGVILNDSSINSRGLYMDKSSALGIHVYCEENCSRHEVIVKECNFTDNSALAGTVIVKVSSGNSTYGSEELVRFENCSWYSNTANISGAAVTLFGYKNRMLTTSAAIHFVTAGLQPSLEQFLQLNLLPCTYGYVYDNTSQMCKCFDSNHIRCNDTLLEACIEYGYWYGKILDSENHTVHPCPTDYCQYSSGRCPVGECKAVPGFCKLPTDRDGLCSESRGSVLCTACTTNRTFTFGAVRCVQTCSKGYYVMLVFLLLVFWVVMVMTVLAILKLNLRVGSGKLYAFIYYFSVVQYVTPGNLPSEFLNVVLSIFAGVTKLNPLFIGEIPVCFPSMNSIDHQFFQYVHPLIISLAIFITILLARFFPRLPNPARNSGIRAICILMLLSFSSLVETSFNLLNPVKFKNSEKTYVNIQADTEFFDHEKHLAFAVIAILVLALIIFPFMLLMFILPFLKRCGVNLTKIKPVVDEYQACYKNKWRWCAGFYFLCRIVVFSVSIFDVGVYGHLYILQIFFLLTVVLHATFQPYTAQWLNIIDILFLSDLAMISLLYGSTADNLFLGDANAQIMRDILLHVLILTPCFYFISIVVSLLLTHTWLKSYILKYYNKQRRVTTHYVTFSTASNMTDGAPSYEVHDREPLLAILSEDETSNDTQYKTFTSSISSSGDMLQLKSQATKEVADQTM